ncbi:MAG: porin, partial [Parvibaculales bacterium]
MTGGLLLGTALPLTAAQAMPIVGLSVGGQFTQSVNIVDADNGRDNDGRTITVEDEVLAQNAEIHFKGKTTLPSGTEFGFRVELEAESATDQIDEHYLCVKGDFGKLILGAENGVGHLMQVRAPRFVPGLKAYDNSLTDAAIEKAYDIVLESNAIEDAHMSTKLEHISGDANKLSYMTPRVGGLQLG